MLVFQYAGCLMYAPVHASLFHENVRCQQKNKKRFIFKGARRNSGLEQSLKSVWGIRKIIFRSEPQNGKVVQVQKNSGFKART
jgi:hypothetical protein